LGFTLAELTPDYERCLVEMRITSLTAATRQARFLLGIMSRYEAVSLTNIWSAWIACIDYRESSNDVRTYLGNGDPIIGTGMKTTDVPIGRGPFSTWQAGAHDALKHVGLVNSMVTAAWEAERWNGFGPREHGVPTGYLWAGTTVYQGGGYPADGEWEPSWFDRRLGVMPLLYVLGQLDPSLIGVAPCPSKPSLSVMVEHSGSVVADPLPASHG
jgi:lysozyme family protein